MSKLKLAKSLFLVAAGISFMLSVGLWFSGQKEQGHDSEETPLPEGGLWVPTILALGAMTFSGREIR